MIISNNNLRRTIQRQTIYGAFKTKRRISNKINRIFVRNDLLFDGRIRIDKENNNCNVNGIFRIVGKYGNNKIEKCFMLNLAKKTEAFFNF